MSPTPKHQNQPYFNASFNDGGVFSMTVTEKGLNVSFCSSECQSVSFLESDQILHRNLVFSQSKSNFGSYEKSRLFLPTVIII